MFHKIMNLLIVLICLALVVSSFSCAVGQSPTSKGLELKLDKAPHLNEPVKLICIRQTKDFFPPGQEKKGSDNVTYENLITDNISRGESKFIPPGQEKKISEKPKHEKITLEFERIDLKTRHLIQVPAQEVLTSGNLNWEGDMTGEPMDFSATIKFPYEGNWGIYARSTERPQDEDDIFLNVAEDSGSFGWMKNYAPMVDPFPDTPSEIWPVTVNFDIAEPPRLNEAFKVTWGISTIRDITEASGGVRFIHMEGTKEISVPVENVLINGDVTWEGSLKKDSPLQFSATVKLPEEGDWAVGAWSRSYAEEEPIGAGSALYMHISKDKGTWGWTESHENPYKGPPPPPTTLP